MSLGQVRMRPKVRQTGNPTNQSAMSGGLFGREPAQYGQTRECGLDFLQRLEQAEHRDSQRSARGQRTGQMAYGKRSQDGGFTSNGGVLFGDDSTPSNGHGSRDDRFQTSNNAHNTQMQRQHQEARQRHEENTIRQLLLENGATEEEAQHEIQLWKRQVASGNESGVPLDPDDPYAQAEQPHSRMRASRGQNGQFLSQKACEDPFKVRTTSSTPAKPKPWEIEDKFKQRAHGASPPGKSKGNAWDIGYDPAKDRRGYTPQRKKDAWDIDYDPAKDRRGYMPTHKSNAWDIDDAFKSATHGFKPQYYNSGNMMAAGGAAYTNGGRQEPFFKSDFNDVNASSVPGGIFG